jgi:hypothetical protein
VIHHHRQIVFVCYDSFRYLADLIESVHVVIKLIEVCSGPSKRVMVLKKRGGRRTQARKNEKEDSDVGEGRPSS